LTSISSATISGSSTIYGKLSLRVTDLIFLSESWFPIALIPLILINSSAFTSIDLGASSPLFCFVKLISKIGLPSVVTNKSSVFSLIKTSSLFEFSIKNLFKNDLFFTGSK